VAEDNVLMTVMLVTGDKLEEQRTGEQAQIVLDDLRATPDSGSFTAAGCLVRRAAVAYVRVKDRSGSRVFV
jgi:hypothetical protein